jgi:hypothetical protein
VESCRQIELDPAWKNAPPYRQHAMRVHAKPSRWSIKLTPRTPAVIRPATANGLPT